MIHVAIEKLVGDFQGIEVAYDEKNRLLKVSVVFRIDAGEYNTIQASVSLINFLEALELAEKNGDLAEFVDFLSAPSWLLPLYQFFRLISSDIVYPVELTLKDIPESVGETFTSPEVKKIIFERIKQKGFHGAHEDFIRYDEDSRVLSFSLKP